MEKNRDFTDKHNDGEGQSLQDRIEENLVAEQNLAALLRSRIPGEK